jgi:hypothetical protein
MKERMGSSPTMVAHNVDSVSRLAVQQLQIAYDVDSDSALA